MKYLPPGRYILQINAVSVSAHQSLTEAIWTGEHQKSKAWRVKDRQTGRVAHWANRNLTETYHDNL